MSELYIPQKLIIGFQERDDTFTGKLAFITYYKPDGEIFRLGSFNTWTNKNIKTIEIDNTPQSGFILNKGVQRSGHWGSGRSVIRVYDSRDFEFEITVDNLIGILMHSDVSKRDIVENCIFAWKGQQLVLLPANSEEYQKSVQYSKKQLENVNPEQLVPGYTYNQKKHDEPLTYIGFFPWLEWKNETKEISYYNRENYKVQKRIGKRHVFFDGKKYIVQKPENLSTIEQGSVADNFAHLMEGFVNSYHSQLVVDAEIKIDYQCADNNRDYYKVKNNSFLLASYREYTNHNGTYNYFRNSNKLEKIIEKGKCFFKETYIGNSEELTKILIDKTAQEATEILIKEQWGTLYFTLANGHEIRVEESLF